MHVERIEAARRQQADLIVFPELSLTGYFVRDMVPDVALSADAAEIGRLIEAAGGSALVAGFVEESPQQRFFNAAFYAEGGRIVHLHRKVYLPTYGLFDEQRYYAPGERFQAFDTARFGRVGIVICEDFWHLSAAAIMQAEEIDLLICVANSPGRGVEGPRLRTAETYEQICTAFAPTSTARSSFCLNSSNVVWGPNDQSVTPIFKSSILRLLCRRGKGDRHLRLSGSGASPLFPGPQEG